MRHGGRGVSPFSRYEEGYGSHEEDLHVENARLRQELQRVKSGRSSSVGRESNTPPNRRRSSAFHALHGRAREQLREVCEENDLLVERLRAREKEIEDLRGDLVKLRQALDEEDRKCFQELPEVQEAPKDVRLFKKRAQDIMKRMQEEKELDLAKADQARKLLKMQCEDSQARYAKGKAEIVRLERELAQSEANNLKQQANLEDLQRHCDELRSMLCGEQAAAEQLRATVGKLAEELESERMRSMHSGEAGETLDVLRGLGDPRRPSVDSCRDELGALAEDAARREPEVSGRHEEALAELQRECEQLRAQLALARHWEAQQPEQAAGAGAEPCGEELQGPPGPDALPGELAPLDPGRGPPVGAAAPEPLGAPSPAPPPAVGEPSIERARRRPSRSGEGSEDQAPRQWALRVAASVVRGEYERLCREGEVSFQAESPPADPTAAAPDLAAEEGQELHHRGGACGNCAPLQRRLVEAEGKVGRLQREQEQLRQQLEDSLALEREHRAAADRARAQLRALGEDPTAPPLAVRAQVLPDDAQGPQLAGAAQRKAPVQLSGATRVPDTSGTAEGVPVQSGGPTTQWTDGPFPEEERTELARRNQELLGALHGAQRQLKAALSGGEATFAGLAEELSASRQDVGSLQERLHVARMCELEALRMAGYVPRLASRIRAVERQLAEAEKQAAEWRQVASSTTLSGMFSSVVCAGPGARRA